MRGGIPRERRPPKQQPGWRTDEVNSRTHPHVHVLRWVTAPVHPPEVQYAGICPLQPPRHAFEIWMSLHDWGLSGWPPIAYMFGRQGYPCVEAYVTPKACDCGEEMCISYLIGETFLPPVGPCQWRNKGKQLYMPQEHLR